jgi:hypothetical protein
VDFQYVNRTIQQIPDIIATRARKPLQQRVIWQLDSAENILRSKNSGTRTTDENPHLITGSLEVANLDRYVACFHDEDKNGRFFRKCQMKDGVIF